LEFLYDSGLSVGKTSEGFKALEALPKSDATDAPSSSASKVCLSDFGFEIFCFYSKKVFFFVLYCWLNVNLGFFVCCELI
jgi:hypothetical protein